MRWKTRAWTSCGDSAPRLCELSSSTLLRPGRVRRSWAPRRRGDPDRCASWRGPFAALAYLTGLAAGYAQRASEITVDTVWSGPGSYYVPVRATAAVLADIVREARRQLLLMTYSAKPHQPLIESLRAAIGRGVTVSVVVETLQGAGSALSGEEPYRAFTGIDGIELWHWPTSRRTEPGSKMHAKLAVADRRVLLITSANLTQSGVWKNIEAGLLIRGGSAPQRAAEHVDALRASGELARLN